jgi:uncharacterized membrane protein
MALLRRLKGYPGHPSHAPLTGVSIGAYTVAVALLVLGALGLEEPAMARAALLATSAGLILTPPTVLTGLLDWRDRPPRTPKRTLANLHLGTKLAAAAIFALSWFPGRAGHHDGRIHAAALILALAGEALLLAGGYLGGTLVYVHGHRVLSQPQTPVGEALRPGRVSQQPQPVESAPTRSRQPTAPAGHRQTASGARRPTERPSAGLGPARASTQARMQLPSTTQQSLAVHVLLYVGHHRPPIRRPSPRSCTSAPDR